MLDEQLARLFRPEQIEVGVIAVRSVQGDDRLTAGPFRERVKVTKDMNIHAQLMQKDSQSVFLIS